MRTKTGIGVHLSFDDLGPEGDLDVGSNHWIHHLLGVANLSFGIACTAASAIDYDSLPYSQPLRIVVPRLFELISPDSAVSLWTQRDNTYDDGDRLVCHAKFPP